MYLDSPWHFEKLELGSRWGLRAAPQKALQLPCIRLPHPLPGYAKPSHKWDGTG